MRRTGLRNRDHLPYGVQIVMNSLKSLVFGLALVASLATIASPGHSARVGEKAALQAAMQQHIDRNLVKGAFLHLEATGRVRPLYPLRAHPMILRMGDYFVLCSDFKDVAGKSVNVDFYMARDDDSYVIFHLAIDDRVTLERWLSEGKVEHFE